MPAKPAWYGKLDHVISTLESLPRSFVDRSTVEFLLGVGRRRAQQIIAPCVTDRVGSNGLADRDALIARLRHLAEGEDGYYEIERRRKLARVLAGMRKDRLERPQLVIAAPTAVTRQEFEDLPSGVRLEPGRITVDFDQAPEALEKLLALAMAISNDFARFERLTGSDGSGHKPGY